MKLKGMLRDSGEALAPLDTRRRLLGRAGLNLARMIRTNLVEVFEELELGSPLDALVSRQRREAEDTVPHAVAETPHKTPIRVLVIDGDPELLANTLRALEEQWWPYHSVEIVGRSTQAMAQVLGDMPARQAVVVLCAGDRPERDLLFRLVDAFWQNPELELVHWDDTVAGSDPRFKPEWSPEMLLSANYIGRSFALRASSWSRASLPLSAAVYWDVLLGLDLDRYQVSRIPLLLCDLGSRPEAVPTGAVEVVQRVLDRRGIQAVAVAEDNAVHLRWCLKEWQSVSIIVPSRFNTSMLTELFTSLVGTDYPSWDLTVIDNSGESDGKLEWYGEWAERLPLSVQWWNEPFNYSAVNNMAATTTSGEVLVFLNDDTKVIDADWLRELVGWSTIDGVGTVGLQLLSEDGSIQHGGVVLGIDGTAGHLFAGDSPGGATMLGARAWIRNTSAVTAACVAIQRGLFDQVGGFDERFELCGSDVVLGLDMVQLGLRNVCSPAVRVEHLEAVTRGTTDVTNDVYTSYWRYQRWLSAGDRYYSPNLSLKEGARAIRSAHEPEPLATLLPALGRSYGVFRQSMSESEAFSFARRCNVSDADVTALTEHHRRMAGASEVHTVNWFVPEFDNPFYGGINTILRIADHLRRNHDVDNRFIVLADVNDAWYRSAIRAAFPGLAESELIFYPPSSVAPSPAIPAADAAIATIWHSAYSVMSASDQKRCFYLIQDFEPGFYPGGTMFALSEETYRLGLYGIGNTEPMAAMYRQRYGGTGSWFLPAVDRSIFHPPSQARESEVTRIFLYARPGHWRNCWEIASLALAEIKRRHGEKVHIVTAGSLARPEDLGRGIEHLGLLDYSETADLYRRCDVGVALTVSEHPSYLPVELMGCGVPVVTFDLPEAYWIGAHGETGLRARQTVAGLTEQLERLVVDPQLRRDLSRGAVAHVEKFHSDWESALEPIMSFLRDPAGSAIEQPARSSIEERK